MKTNPPETRAPRGDEKIRRKWSWHLRTLRQLRERLAQERGQHRHAAAATELDDVADTTETAAEAAEREVILAELSAEANALAEIDTALERLRLGSYGVCEATGKEIPAARLRAVPWTRFTREAAAERERRAR